MEIKSFMEHSFNAMYHSDESEDIFGACSKKVAERLFPARSDVGVVP